MVVGGAGAGGGDPVNALETLLARLPPDLRQRARRDVSLAEHTSYRVGGPAALWLEAGSEAEVQVCCAAITELGVPLALLGNGSNVIAPDAGIEGVLLKFGAPFAAIATVDADHLDVQAGAVLAQVAERALELGRSGLEWMVDIPGSVGGAVLMNAGNNEGEMQAVVERVRFLDARGELREVPVADCELDYRHSRFKGRGEIVLGARFRLGPVDDREAIAARMQAQRTTRGSKFPMGLPNAGSVFKRPTGHYAGQLIEQAGLKGLRVGDAEVSTKHAGFIVNRGQASAADILGLIALVQRRVLDHAGVQLEPEQIPLAVRPC